MIVSTTSSTSSNFELVGPSSGLVGHGLCLRLGRVQV